MYIALPFLQGCMYNKIYATRAEQLVHTVLEGIIQGK